MTKRPSLRANVVPIVDETAAAAEHAAQLQARQRPPEPAGDGAADGEREPYTTSTIHLPQDLLEVLQQAALRRAARKRRADPKGRGGRASVSEIVVDLLSRHRDELDRLD